MTTTEFRYCIVSTKQLAEIMRIERASYPEPWKEKEMRQLLTAPEYFGVGAFAGMQLVGYAIWASHDTKIILHNIAVDPEYRRQGVGRGIVEWLRQKVLQTTRRKWIEIVVSELNLAALCFFRATGFRAVWTMKNHFKDQRDAYLMTWRRPRNS